ncbi:MAG: hypothetical protein U9Q07_00910 [Planctomycetota bacterium]|nr:hypothetical protein [Planctomycetota bacterium]
MIRMFKSFSAAVELFLWLRAQKKLIEQDVNGYLSAERAEAWRLAAEQLFRRLQTGRTDDLPRVVRWLFDRTTVDNRAGWFGLRLLKSGKLERGDPVLDRPVNTFRGG